MMGMGTELGVGTKRKMKSGVGGVLVMFARLSPKSAILKACSKRASPSTPELRASSFPNPRGGFKSYPPKK